MPYNGYFNFVPLTSLSFVRCLYSSIIDDISVEMVVSTSLVHIIWTILIKNKVKESLNKKYLGEELPYAEGKCDLSYPERPHKRL